MLLCPVRTCHLPLVRDGRRLLCERAHSFDVARSGYINLLQPQDRRSKQPGDTKAAVAARRRLHDLGVTAPLLRAIAEITAPRPDDAVLDAGCGDGFYLGTLARETGFDAHGVDISTFAADAAAERFPPGERCEWIVANADRFIPYADRSFSLVLSITARMNATEFWRVLRGTKDGNAGRLLVAVPSPEDLIELRGHLAASTEPAQPPESGDDGGDLAEHALFQRRSVVQAGDTMVTGRDRVERTLETFASNFTLADQRRVTATADLSAEAVQDVLVSIYRPLRSKPVEAMHVTFSLDLLLFHCQ